MSILKRAVQVAAVLLQCFCCRAVQVAAVLLQCFCCRVPQRRAHQETEEPHNDYRRLLQGSVVIAYPETKVRKVMYESSNSAGVTDYLASVHY